jgi:ADP-L-glycero-D-manno-heptose 6-epimerase
MILVTGGAGFIGSNLVAGLLESGRGAVAVVDRLGQDDKWRNLAKHDLEALIAPEGLGDFLRDRGKQVEFVYHLGAISSTLERDVDLIVETNLRLSQALWTWCIETMVPLVYASSAATYGDGSAGFQDGIDPATLERLRPLNPYGWSKHAFDRWVAQRVRRGENTPPHWAGVKFFNVYGPNEYHKDEMRSVVCKAYPRAAAGEPAVLFRSHRPDYPDGGQKRDFIYVRDCVDVLLWLHDHQEANGLFNLGTGEARSWLDLMEALYQAVGRPLSVDWVDIPEPMRDRYQYFTEADMSALRVAGYNRPFMSIEDGVRDYVQSFLATADPYR